MIAFFFILNLCVFSFFLSFWTLWWRSILAAFNAAYLVIVVKIFILHSTCVPDGFNLVKAIVHWSLISLQDILCLLIHHFDTSVGTPFFWVLSTSLSCRFENFTACVEISFWSLRLLGEKPIVFHFPRFQIRDVAQGSDRMIILFASSGALISSQAFIFGPSFVSETGLLPLWSNLSCNSNPLWIAGSYSSNLQLSGTFPMGSKIE